MSTRFEQIILAVAPKANKEFLAASVACDAVAIMRAEGFTDVNSQAHLIGHMSVECVHFTRFDENLNYRAETLTKTWPSRYPPHRAPEFAHNPRKLAIDCYGSRGGNRPGTTDGWDFRGSGGLQHTFRPEFERVQRRTGLPVVAMPDQLRDKRNAEAIWKAAASYFKDKPGALEAAKTGNVELSTRKVNGGTNGLKDRRICIDRALDALGGRPLVPTESRVEAPSRTAERAGLPSPTERTTVEVQDDEKKKRDTAVTGTAVGSPSSGGVASQTTKQTDWVLVGGITLAVALVGFLIIRHYWRRHAEAREVVQTQDLTQIMQRFEASAA